MLNGGICFVAGGMGYGAIELLWRGYTHFTMLITGGICFLILCFLARLEWNLMLLSLLGGLSITAVELFVGCTVNLWLGWKVWDYSKQFGNLWGQICPSFTAVWCGFTALVVVGYRLSRRWIQAKRQPVGQEEG